MDEICPTEGAPEAVKPLAPQAFASIHMGLRSYIDPTYSDITESNSSTVE
jgi:hypothetical protein